MTDIQTVRPRKIYLRFQFVDDEKKFRNDFLNTTCIIKVNIILVLIEYVAEAVVVLSEAATVLVVTAEVTVSSSAATAVYT